MKTVADVLDFWFRPGHREKWFVNDADFDAAVAGALAAPDALAQRGGLSAWRDGPEGCLALCLLLDQVPRNLYRGRAEAFACDQQARAVTRHALAQGHDRGLTQEQRLFLYMPLEHSEDLADQEESCRLFAELDENPGWHDYALRHHAIIARFGRFPHRNAVLGRRTTAAEEVFLTEPGSSF